MDLMDLLRTPWRVGALYLYGLIYISTDFWDFKDFCVHGSYGSTGFKVYGLSGLKGLAARAMAGRGGISLRTFGTLRTFGVQKVGRQSIESLKSVEKKGAR